MFIKIAAGKISPSLLIKEIEKTFLLEARLTKEFTQTTERNKNVEEHTGLNIKVEVENSNGERASIDMGEVSKDNQIRVFTYLARIAQAQQQEHKNASLADAISPTNEKNVSNKLVVQAWICSRDPDHNYSKDAFPSSSTGLRAIVTPDTANFDPKHLIARDPEMYQAISNKK